MADVYELRLKLLCFRVLRHNYSALSARIPAVLPCDLLEELQLHLTVCQLDQLQPALNSRGVSTLRGWRNILQQLRKRSCGHVKTEDEAKSIVMKELFSCIMYDSKRSISSYHSSLDTPSFLRAAATYLKDFILPNVLGPLRRLTTEWQTGLQQLQKSIRTVTLSHPLDPSDPENQPALLVLHRLLDHGRVRKVVFTARCRFFLDWILTRRSSQSNTSAGGSSTSSSGDDGGPASKHARLDAGLGLGVCGAPGPSGRVCEREDEGLGAERSGRLASEKELDCPGDCVGSAACLCRRPIEALELRNCQEDCLRVLLSVLPSWRALRDLSIDSHDTLPLAFSLDLVNALKKLSTCPDARHLINLNIGTLQYPSLIERLLDSCPRLLSLSAEAHNLLEHSSLQDLPVPPKICPSSLQMLRLSLNQQLSPGHLMPSLVRRCPHLRSLHVSGLRLQSEASYGRLLTALSESCGRLRTLHLEDVNLSDSMEHILVLLERCQLNVLELKDCRLLEKWENKEESLKRLTTALANHRSLQRLGLAHNRIAKHVPVLAQLFMESALVHVDLSSNFIQPDELLEFSRRLKALRPNQRVVLDLRRNPGDRDPTTWRLAVSNLAPYWCLQLDDWSSTDTMVDHVSNM